MRNRKTLKEAILFEGTGLHTGERSRIILKPSSANGYSFNFVKSTFSLAHASFSGDGRGTVLHFPGGKRIGTVEHLLAALRGCGVDDVEICVEKGIEVPSLDGSARSYADLINRTGFLEKNEDVKPLTIAFPVGVDMEEQGSSIFAFPSSSFRITYVIDYENRMIGTQMKRMEVSPESFLKEIAPARTFALEEDMDTLIQRGLARGGDLSNAILVREEEVLTEGGLRFKDEFVRHKILDLIGDLAILDGPPCFHVVCFRGGHSLHLRLVRKLIRKKGINL